MGTSFEALKSREKHLSSKTQGTVLRRPPLPHKLGVPKPGCFKLGCLQFLCKSALLCSFCAHLRSFALICALLRSFACFCKRPRLERPRLGTAEQRSVCADAMPVQLRAHLCSAACSPQVALLPPSGSLPLQRLHAKHMPELHTCQCITLHHVSVAIQATLYMILLRPLASNSNKHIQNVFPGQVGPRFASANLGVTVGTNRSPKETSLFLVGTRRIGANPEKSDLVNFRGPD